MTYRDPNQPHDSDSPTQAYRLPDPDVPDAGRVEGPAPEPAPTTRAMPAGAGPRPSRARWAVAIVVVALVVAASGLAAVLLTGRAPSSTVLGWAPADAVGYMEVRLDLPGDQRANLGSFLAHFPGFDDRAALDVKLNETLDQVVYSASRGDQSYIRDIEPWFEGEVAFVSGELPDMAAGGHPASKEAPEEGVGQSGKG